MGESNRSRSCPCNATAATWTCVTLAILLVCASAQSASTARAVADAAKPERPSIRILERVSYGREAPEAQMLNAYLVQRDRPAPAIVQILSGGWNSAPPRGVNLEPFTPYLDAGISVIVAAHRPVNENTHWPAPGDDIARAIQFVRERAGEWGIDPNRIAAKGRSSGGHLALMVGFGPDRADPAGADPVSRRSSRPNCIVAGAAPTDLVQQMSALLKDENRQEYLWGRIAALLGVSADVPRNDLIAKLKPLSPIEYVDRNSPPVFLTHQGPADAFWPGDSRLQWDAHTPITGLILEKRLKDLQVPYELVISPDGARSDPTLLRRELAFLGKHLGTEGILQNRPPAASGERIQYTHGAKFEPPAGRVVHAMGQWEQYNAKLLPRFPAQLRPASKLIFVTIGDTPRGWRPEGVAATIQRYDREGFVPHIDIGLRGNQPRNEELAKLADPLFGIDHEVASTSRFDGRIQDLVQIVKDYGKPVIVRIGGEFNGRWNGYHPYAYPKAFRKIVGMFRTAQAENAAFVWCYEPAAPGDFDEKNAAGEYKWFPGEDVIDWFSIDWFNANDFTGPLTGGRQGANLLTPHGRTRKFLDMAVTSRKPVMIAESSPCRYDLSDPAQAEAAWKEWFEPYFAIIAERVEIKWFHLISYDWTRASYYASTGWKNNDLTVSPMLLQKLTEELHKPKYLHTNDKALLKDYSEVASTPSSASIPEAVRPARTSRVHPAVPDANQIAPSKRAELAKFDDPAGHLPARGPGGTEWDSHYRCFIQSEESALSKGFPSHEEAARQIKADAARDPANLAKHKGWVLFIKHHSQAYRPQEATGALRKLYTDLVEMESAGPRAPVKLPFDGDPRLTIHRDIAYGTTHPDTQRMDAYLVKSSEPAPVLIEIHGGGWRQGARSQFTYRGDLIDAVLAAGISVISIDYRLTPEHTFPAQMEDVARAVQFVRSKACHWSLDPNRIAAIGGSAGAHLAAWVGLHNDLGKPDSPDPVERLSSRLSCFVALSGPMDLLRVDPRTLAQAGVRGESFAQAFTAAVGSTPEQFMTNPDIRRRLKEASPLFLVSSDDPPAMVVGAGPTETALIPPAAPATINDPHSAWHGALLADALRRAGVEVVARLGPEVGKNPQADATEIVDFLKRHLNGVER